MIGPHAHGLSPSPPCLAELRYSGPFYAKVKAASKETLRIGSDEPILVGRKAGLEADEMITMLDLDQQPKMLSARHARLQFDIEDHSLRICDLGSRNGTQINGVRIKDGVLLDGDVVTFGGASTCEIGERPSEKAIRSLWQYTVHVLDTQKARESQSQVHEPTISKDGPKTSEFESLDLRTPSAARVEPPCLDSASETKRWSPAESSAFELKNRKRLREEEDAPATPFLEEKRSELFKAREQEQETGHESGVLFIRLSGVYRDAFNASFRYLPNSYKNFQNS